MAFEVEYFTLTPTDSANELVVLAGTPVDSNDVVMDTISGTAQALTNDFGVTDSTVRWDSGSYGLNGILSSGDRIRLMYDKS